jgi:hypothetical protein
MEPSGLAFGKPKDRLGEIRDRRPAFCFAPCGLRAKI